MAGYQFFREETYGQFRSQGAPTTRAGKPSRGRRAPGKLSAGDILAEACRIAGSHPHVKTPSPARVLHGLSPADLPCWYDQLVLLASRQVTPSHTKSGAVTARRQRSDTPIVLGAVASYPGPADDNDDGYVRWRELTVTFMQSHYVDGLVSVLEHVDEAYGHLHGIVSNAGASVKPMHAGHAAAAKAGTAKDKSAAYRAAERELQDAFFAQVAKHCNLARVGPRRRRLTRAEWHVDQEARLEARKLEDTLAVERRRLDDDRARFERDRHRFAEVLDSVVEYIPTDLLASVAGLFAAQPLPAAQRSTVRQTETGGGHAPTATRPVPRIGDTP